MANQFKSIWIIIALVSAGVVIFFITIASNNSKPQTVVLQDIFTAQQDTKPADVNQVMTDPVTSPAIVEETDFGKQTGFAIQVYSFQDKKRAYAALDALKASKYEAYMIISDLGEKGTWYRVRIGGINDEATAKKVLDQIRKDYNSGFIVKPVVKQ